jgi:hypothetical protein
MSETVTKAMKRPGVVPAALTGLGVLAALLAIGFVQSLFSALSLVATASIDGGYVGQIWFAQLVSSLTGPLPFAVGVFLCLWQVAPIAPALRLAHVVTRSILAALIGGGVMWIVFWVVQLVADVAQVAPEFQGGIVFGKLGPDAIEALFRALAVTAGYLPVAVLAGILLWGWLQRHPLDKPVHGTLDEV